MERLLEHGRFGNEIIVGNLRVEVSAPVLTWHQHKMQFIEGEGARRRHPKQKIDLIVLHWTGGEATARQTFKVLTGRELGVEFVIDRQGLIWQFADPARIDTFDAGPVNPRSVGIEMTNYGFRRPNTPVPRHGRVRPLWRQLLNGRQREFASFFPAQVDSAVHLCDALCRVLPAVPRRIPRDKRGAVLKRTMTRSELREYSGILGHFHVSRRKSDPGTDLMTMFEEAGY